MTILLYAAFAGLLAGCNAPRTNETVQPDARDETGSMSPGKAAPLALRAADGVVVYGLYYEALKPQALILLFHQADSNKGEYATIAPQLVAAGYSALAIDQRSGGELLETNRTFAELGHSAKYLEALADLQVALDWAGDKRLPVVLWGSSSSSALIFRLVAQNPGTAKALLAFSPGEYFDDKTFVRRNAAMLDVPVYVTSAPDAEKVALATQVFDAITAPRRSPPEHGLGIA